MYCYTRRRVLNSFFFYKGLLLSARWYCTKKVGFFHTIRYVSRFKMFRLLRKITKKREMIRWPWIGRYLLGKNSAGKIYSGRISSCFNVFIEKNNKKIKRQFGNFFDKFEYLLFCFINIYLHLFCIIFLSKTLFICVSNFFLIFVKILMESKSMRIFFWKSNQAEC